MDIVKGGAKTADWRLPSFHKLPLRDLQKVGEGAGCQTWEKRKATGQGIGRGLEKSWMASSRLLLSRCLEPRSFAGLRFTKGDFVRPALAGLQAPAFELDKVAESA